MALKTIQNAENLEAIKAGIPITANPILKSQPVFEVVQHWAKNTAINTETTAVQFACPEAPVLMWQACMTNSSIDSDMTVRLYNRLTFHVTGTAQAGDATHITLAATANPTNDHYNGFVITITGGTGAGQTRTIVDYVGATVVAEVAAWDTNPDNTSTYSIALVRDVLIHTLTFAKASLTAPVTKAWGSALLTGLFTNGADVYMKMSNNTAIANADASRFTCVFQLLPVA